MKGLKKLIPTPYLTDRKLYRRAKLILQINLLTFFISMGLIPFYFLIDFPEGAMVMIFALICSIVFPILLNITQNLTLSGHFFALTSCIVLISMVLLTGGIRSPYFVWLLSFPPITILYMKPRTAYFWLGFLGLLTLGIFSIETMDYSLPNHQSPIWFAPTFLFSFTMVFVVCVAVVQLFLKGFQSFNSKLKKSNKNLQQSNEELERFAYIASHDLKSPLRNIVSFVNLIERRYSQKLEGSGNEYLDIVKKNALQMHHLIEDILEYSQTNNKELRREKVDLVKMLLEITTDLQASGKYVPSEVTFDKIPMLYADTATLSQLFHNLIENGLKYNNNPLPQIKIEFIHQRNRLQFKITDNGIGIEEDYKNSIFEMFKRLHNQEIYRGTGIGLAVCKKIVERYHGQIWVTSKVGQGSTFHIFFPEDMLAEPEIFEGGLVGVF